MDREVEEIHRQHAELLARIADEPWPVPLPQEVPVMRERGVGRVFVYGIELEVDGRIRVCVDCGAERDWLVINQDEHVWVRCRCGHQWYEPQLTRYWFLAAWMDDEGPAFATLEDAIVGYGFDGALRGSYWN
ncbi:hypothetical protein ACFWPU_13865 [Streptomyces sp. NPDC058471]|uniref:hypothetical protein n=1 Tax=Streptomyces sp. NPDC058471 TaxID=3346516 RepID=UPI00365E8CF9